MVPYLIANDKIVLLLNNKQYQVLKEDENYQKVVDGITAGLSADKLEELAKPKGAAVVSYLTKNNDGDITICGNSVLFKGQEIKNPAVTRLLSFVRDKLPIGPLKLFLTKLYSNPSHASIQALYDFLEHKNLPITEDGDFLAYKAVRDNYKDKHSGTIDNHVGAVVEMPRNEVDDERNNHCSAGLHAGAMEYVSGFKGPNDIILIVKINPADVVSVPKDCNCTKLRCCRYEVVAHYDGDLTKPLYNNKAEDYPVDTDSYDCEDEEDEEYLDDYTCDEDCDCEEDSCLQDGYHTVTICGTVPVKEQTILPDLVKSFIGQGYKIDWSGNHTIDRIEYFCYQLSKGTKIITIKYIGSELHSMSSSDTRLDKEAAKQLLAKRNAKESTTINLIDEGDEIDESEIAHVYQNHKVIIKL